MRSFSILRLLLAAVCALLAGQAFATAISGIWKTNLGGTEGPALFFTFKVEGEKLTGSVESPWGNNELKDGRIEGDKFGFTVPFDGELIAYRCRVLANEEIEMELIGVGNGELLKLRRTDEAALQASRQPATSAQPPRPPRTHAWWNERPVGQRAYTVDAKKLPLVSVQGNKFVDSSGAVVLFRGLAISDPDKLEMQGHWNREHFVQAKELGARLIRIPVHPVAWRERTPPEYLRLLDQAVGWCTELDLYVMLDWHCIGNLVTGVFQDPMYDTTLEETNNFWRVMARHYAGHNTVVFYELFNEPTTYRNQLGPIAWADWKRIVEAQIALIRAANPQAIPVVAGFDWAYDLTPVRLEPIAAERIAYSVHPYANKRPQPWAAKWELDFGFVADKYPVIATEFGGFPKAAAPTDANTAATVASPAPAGAPPAPADGSPAPPPVKNATYGPEIIAYLESKGISWTVWCFDPEWGPTLIKNWNYDLSPSGEFAKQALHGGTAH